MRHECWQATGTGDQIQERTSRIELDESDEEEGRYHTRPTRRPSLGPPPKQQLKRKLNSIGALADRSTKGPTKSPVRPTRYGYAAKRLRGASARGGGRGTGSINTPATV